MRCGYSVSTPASRLAEVCRMWATLAMYDALKFGPVPFTRLS